MPYQDDDSYLSDYNNDFGFDLDDDDLDLDGFEIDMDYVEADEELYLYNSDGEDFPENDPLEGRGFQPWHGDPEPVDEDFNVDQILDEMGF